MKAYTYRKLTQFVMAAMVTLLIGGGTLSAQQERSYQWKLQHDLSNRYEGVHNDPYVHKELDLIGFYAGVQAYQFGFGQNLAVHFYSPTNTSAYIKAEELYVRSRFWMETKEGNAKAGWNSFKNWPVDMWLWKARVPAENLGLVAKARINGYYGDFYLPLIVNQNDYPSELTQHFVLFRTGINLGEGVARAYAGLPSTSGLPDYTNALGEPIRIHNQTAGNSFGIKLTQNQIGNYQGWITLEVTCKKQNQSGYLTQVYYLYHPGWTPQFSMIQGNR